LPFGRRAGSEPAVFARGILTFPQGQLGGLTVLSLPILEENMRKLKLRDGDGARIRKLALAERIDLLFICDEKLRRHEIWRQDALNALRTCSIVHSEHLCGEWRRTIRGVDRDDGEIFLVVAVDYATRRIVVIDGWRK
jgi:hypothetical protein